VATKETKTQRVRKAAGAGTTPAKPLKGTAPKKAAVRAPSGTNDVVQGTPKPHIARPHIAALEANTETQNPVLHEVLREIRGLRAAIEPIMKPPSGVGADLDESVEALRRLLSELIEQRMEAVVQQVADIRRDAAALPTEHATRIADRLDELLESLGAERFDAEPMDMVDPLIHVVVAERVQQDVPDGVIVESVRPGYRTSRGRVVCKAAVAVSQRG
jgi:hypothetical protein